MTDMEKEIRYIAKGVNIAKILGDFTTTLY